MSDSPAVIDWDVQAANLSLLGDTAAGTMTSSKMDFGFSGGSHTQILDNLNIKVVVNHLAATCHQESANWWLPDADGKRQQDNPLMFSNKLCLIHSEISEAMEGDRKSLMDSHLPHRQAREVELADAMIRILDLAGAYGMDLGGAMAEKIAYNAQRADHKLENRAKAGGKAY